MSKKLLNSANDSHVENTESNIVSYLRDGNVAKYVNILSDEDVLNALLSRKKRTGNKDAEEVSENLSKIEGKERTAILNAFSDVMQSITSEALFTNEILEMIYNRFSSEDDFVDENTQQVSNSDSIIDYLGKVIKIVHATDYRIKTNNFKSIKLSDTPFSIPFEIPDVAKTQKTFSVLVKSKKAGDDQQAEGDDTLSESSESNEKYDRNTREALNLYKKKILGKPASQLHHSGFQAKRIFANLGYPLNISTFKNREYYFNSALDVIINEEKIEKKREKAKERKNKLKKPEKTKDENSKDKKVSTKGKTKKVTKTVFAGEYRHASNYGLLSTKVLEETYKKLNLDPNSDVQSEIYKFEQDGRLSEIFKSEFKKYKQESDKNVIDSDPGLIFSIDYIVNKKINSAETNKKKKQIQSDKDDNKIVFVNKINHENESIICDKKNPSLSFMLIDHPDIRIGTRNSIELATFFNSLSTIELSKCQPFFNATFILPSKAKSSDGRIFKTASITQFLDGTIKDDSFSNNYQTLEASFVRPLQTRKGKIEQDAVSTNLSAFTMPQTVNNFDEKLVGHFQNFDAAKLEKSKFKRMTTVHDYARPFLTIKSFDIDVAPTQGLMSFKTGKLSLILHDKTRMSDIAPFVKPDMFGSFGAEIAIEYGWSHMDGGDFNKPGSERNYIGEFLNNARSVEKYIITNSSFNMDKNGQINIDLSVAMRGPIDIRTATLSSDPPKEFTRNNFIKSTNDFSASIQNSIYPVVVNNYLTQFTNEANTITGNDDLSLKRAKIDKIKEFVRAFPINFKNVAKKNLSESNFKNYIATEMAKIQVATGDTTAVNTTQKKYAQLEVIFEKMNRKISKKGVPVENKFIVSQRPIQYNERDLSNGVERLSQDELIDSAASFYAYYKSLTKITGALSEVINRQKKILKEIVSSLDMVDPFYNKEWLKQYNKIVKNNDLSKGLHVLGIGGANGTSYVSLGSFLTGLIGTHLVNTEKFDEIQVLSYTANENCGLASSMNVSSFLLPRKELSDFLTKLFESGTSLTIESIMSQVIQRFITTRNQICYGLNEFYTRDSAGNTVLEKKYKKLKTKQFQNKIDVQLAKIYVNLTKKEHDPVISAEDCLKNLTGEEGNKNDTSDIVKFNMPKIKLSFDTLTSRKSGYQRTICRISIFDQNDNPFQSIHDLMKKIYESGDQSILSYSAKLNKNKIEYESQSNLSNIKADKKGKSKINKSLKKKRTSRESLRISKKAHYERQERLLKKAVAEGVLKYNQEKGVYEITSQNFIGSTVKESMKKIMPSVTYGAQNSGVIDASLSSVNEAKLNTIYLTRSDRGADGNTTASKVQFKKNMPLKVLPSQASITTWGCPFANFAQYVFLDFETGTTIDNAYAITGLKHNITPGKYTTTLTLAFGDVYSKYENAANTISRELENIKKEIKDSELFVQIVDEEGEAIIRNIPSTRQDSSGNYLKETLKEPAATLVEEVIKYAQNKKPNFFTGSNKNKRLFHIISGYRSYEEQAILYKNALIKYNNDPKEARKWVAPPGKSQHQTGTAFDINFGFGAKKENIENIKKSEAYKWFVDNVANGIFEGVIENYKNEPWHWSLPYENNDLFVQKLKNLRESSEDYQDDVTKPNKTEKSTNQKQDSYTSDADSDKTPKRFTLKKDEIDWGEGEEKKKKSQNDFAHKKEDKESTGITPKKVTSSSSVDLKKKKNEQTDLVEEKPSKKKTPQMVQNQFGGQLNIFLEDLSKLTINVIAAATPDPQVNKIKTGNVTSDKRSTVNFVIIFPFSLNDDSNTVEANLDLMSNTGKNTIRKNLISILNRDFENPRERTSVGITKTPKNCYEDITFTCLNKVMENFIDKNSSITRFESGRVQEKPMTDAKRNEKLLKIFNFSSFVEDILRTCFSIKMKLVFNKEEEKFQNFSLKQSLNVTDEKLEELTKRFMDEFKISEFKSEFLQLLTNNGVTLNISKYEFDTSTQKLIIEYTIPFKRIKVPEKRKTYSVKKMVESIISGIEERIL